MFTTKDIFDHMRKTGLTELQVASLYTLMSQGASLDTIANFAGLVKKEEVAPSGFKFSKTSLERIATVHPDLQKVVLRAIELSPVDITVIEGVRTVKQAYINFGKGRSVSELKSKGVPAEYAKPSLAKVTWVSNPLSSKHMLQKSGYSHAIDLAPYPIDWNDLKRFDQMANAMFAAAKELGVNIRWGADWNGNGVFREKGEFDSPHFEI